jgi:ribosome biogenesis GTPase
MDLSELGFGPEIQADFDALAIKGTRPGRVVAEHRGAWRVVWGPKDEGMAAVPGRMRHRSASPLDLPAVGDWVAVRAQKGRRPVILGVLPRRSVFVRKAAGLHTRAQLVAANIDLALVVMGLDQDFNLRRLERYLAGAWQSGARPVVLLNKVDLSDDVDAQLEDVHGVAGEAPVLVIGAKHGIALDALDQVLLEGLTCCLLGSSGVGKSTLLNQLAGDAVAPTQEVRAYDGKGRHTTTHRELFRIRNGALVIDTPGMRELRLWTGEGLDEAFPEVSEIAVNCQFRDCHHEGDDGCAVLQAVEDGDLDLDRWDSYTQLKEELAELDEELEEARRRARRRANARPRAR